jgi:hypothetical protein
MVDKVIISNKTALQQKYGAAGFNVLDKAVAALIAADAARKLTTQCIWVDDAAQMKSFGGKPPVNQKEERGYTAAVDAIVAKLAPDYIVLLDGPDIVPHIVLDNPVPNDGDNTIDSDLPYATTGTFSRQLARNLKVTRVVGRIPNVPGAKVPDKILGYLKTAAAAKPAAAKKYQDYFGISADVWQASTQMSLNAAFGDSTGLALAPPAAPPNTNGKLAKVSHFINCHGATISPQFYGQSGSSYPVAMTSAQVEKNAAKGAVVAAECCYGAQLYDPQLADGADPICIAYLDREALGFLGSTNIAYGPAASNAQADLITQYFFENVVAGASLGRALLQARQRFITTQKMTDPTNLKTLGQFLLLGDPSVVPCVASEEDSATHGILVSDPSLDGSAQRKSRRVTLASIGTSIVDGKAVPAGPGEASERAKEKIRGAAKARGYADAKEAIFAIRGGGDFRTAMKANSVEESVMVISSTFEAPPHIIAIRHLVAHVIGDGAASIEETLSR